MLNRVCIVGIVHMSFLILLALQKEEISSKQKKCKKLNRCRILVNIKSMLFLFVIDMFMLYRFGITPLLHEFQLGKSKILTDFILMERIEGVTLFQYYEYSKHIGMREVESEALKKARWRIRGLRVSERVVLHVIACCWCYGVLVLKVAKYKMLAAISAI